MTQRSQTYLQLARFIGHEMRMSHVYQPVMLRELLRRNGSAAVTDVARALLAEDRSQLEYYEQITKNMVGRVLTANRGITVDGARYRLKQFSHLAAQEVADLIKLCDNKVSEYLGKRDDPWSHRRKSTGYIPGTQRYEVLKRARYRCELCGVSAEVKALEVDHIIPRNRGGSDDETNLQALCYSCNATKRDRDDADFRGMAASYQERKLNCVFCSIESDRIIDENQLCFVVRDGFPVSPYHTLVIPKRHVSDFFDLYQPELNAVYALLHAAQLGIRLRDTRVTGFNVGMNVGEDAGQTIFHAHVHLIPRRNGDVPEQHMAPRGLAARSGTSTGFSPPKDAITAAGRGDVVHPVCWDDLGWVLVNDLADAARP
jgi:diadenosine tetraphosphate (Ap4A) HIT family hydrolase/5-methylcytosine-specific restriction endonuclease McrA